MVLFVVDTDLSLFRFVWCLVVSNRLKLICPLLIFRSIIRLLVDVFYVNYLNYPGSIFNSHSHLQISNSKMLLLITLQCVKHMIWGN